jgi:hypothetical protein
MMYPRGKMTDIRDIVGAAVAGCGGNQAALAVELGVTGATVSRWMSGQSIPDEGSCLRLAKITGHVAAEVFRLAGRDPSVLPTEREFMADAELAGRLRQWARRIGVLSAPERTVALSLLDDVVKSVCQRLGEGELSQSARFASAGPGQPEPDSMTRTRPLKRRP